MKTIVSVDKYCGVINQLHLGSRTIKASLKKRRERKDKERLFTLKLFKVDLLFHQNDLFVYLVKDFLRSSRLKKRRISSTFDKFFVMYKRNLFLNKNNIDNYVRKF